MRKLVVRKDFAESVEFAHAAADELGRLRAEVENDDFLLHRGQNMGLAIILIRCGMLWTGVCRRCAKNVSPSAKHIKKIGKIQKMSCKITNYTLDGKYCDMKI